MLGGARLSDRVVTPSDQKDDVPSRGPRSHAIDMVFICMPYAAVERPSLALGTLAAALGREGISARSIHANLEFAARVGRPFYETFNNSEITLQIGEWTFAEAAFRQEGDIDAFVEGLIRFGFSASMLRELLLGMRVEAARFVEELAQRVVALKPAIVGCSSVFQQHCASLAVLRRIRELDPSVTTMMGGANCEGEMGAATHRAYTWVDFVVSGEADRLLPDLCRLILTQGKGAPADLLPHGVLGPASRAPKDATGAAQPAPFDARALISDLDDLPVPNFDDYFEELAASPLREYITAGLPIETSRGCWWGAKHHCTFCGLNGSGMAFRSKSQDRVEEEVRYLVDRYKIKRFMAVDNILDNKYFAKALPFLAEAGDMLWFYEIKANLNRAQVEMLARAGVRWIQPGIEALHDDLLSLLRKGCTTVVNVQLLKWAYNNGIWVMWNHLHGAPGEDLDWYEQVADWLPLIAHLQPPSGGSLTPIRFDRFSPYFNNQESFGLNLEPCWGYAQAYPGAPEQLHQQAYFFRDDRPPIETPARLAAEVRGWTSSFYAHTETAGILPRRSEGAPILQLIVDDEGVRVRDTRPCAISGLHVLSELEGLVCQALDTALGENMLTQALSRTGYAATEKEIAETLDRLVDLKIVARLSGKFLCLATDEHAIPYRPFSEFAGGMLSLSTREAPRAVAPGDVPLRELFASAL